MSIETLKQRAEKSYRERLKRIKESETIFKVIDTDAKIRGQLKDEEGNTCVLGGLMQEIGIEPGTEQEQPDTEQINKLLKKFPLLNGVAENLDGDEEERIDVLMHTNDEYEDRARRKKALRELIESWILE